MPFNVNVPKFPQGVAVTSARENETVEVLMTEFLSTEDGQLLVQRLEQFVDKGLSLIPDARRPLPSQVDHMLIVLGPDGSGTIYVNELELKGRVRANRAIKKGDRIGVDDIADVIELDVGVSIPPTSGVLFFLSHGWRRGLFYDWRPLAAGKGPERTEDLRVVFGQMHAHLLFQEMHSLTEADWEGFFVQQWFPFKSLKRDTLLKMRDYIRTGWAIDELLPEITAQVRSAVESWAETWATQSCFANHIQVFCHAVDRFLAGDYLSATHLVYPRVEGLLRSSIRAVSDEHATQKSMAEHASHRLTHLSRSLLLPRHFSKYLETVYFAAFDPESPNVKVSRNTVSHGVAPALECNEKACVVGLLIIRHLSLCLADPTTPAQ